MRAEREREIESFDPVFTLFHRVLLARSPLPVLDAELGVKRSRSSEQAEVYRSSETLGER